MTDTTLTNGAPVGTREDRTRRLQLLGVAPEVIAPLIDYVDALNAAQLKQATARFPHLLGDGDVSEEHRQQHADRYGFGLALTSPSPMRYMADCEPCAAGDGFPRPSEQQLNSYFDVDPEQTGAAKYLQVVNIEHVRARSVHSVVIKETGEVCKSGGWRKGPAKSTSKARKGQPLVAYILTHPDSYAAMVSRLDTYGSYLYSR